MSPEMPFPLGSTVSTIVKITDSNGNSIKAELDRLHTKVDSMNSGFLEADGLTQKISEQMFKSGTYINYVGSVTDDTTIYTVPSNKRLILTTATMHNNNATPITQMNVNSTTPQDSILLINVESYKLHSINHWHIIEQNLPLRINFMSGGGSTNQCRYKIHGILIDRV